MERERIDELTLEPLLGRFYDRVRLDPELGPVFGEAVRDWPAHIERLATFWSSVMLTSGRYKGNPVAAHMVHADAITPGMFDRWLSLWADVTNEMLPGTQAEAMQAKAMRISESLRMALRLRSPEGRAEMLGRQRPDRSTPDHRRSEPTST